jgi:hypothetical protein
MKSKRRTYRSTHEYLGMVRRIIRSAGYRVAGADPEDLAELVALHVDLDDAILRAVAGQREAGITWESIGTALGITRQGAILRYNHRITKTGDTA